LPQVYGAVLATKVLRDASGASRASGFVEFSTHAEAKAARAATDRQSLRGGRALYVNWARRSLHASILDGAGGMLTPQGAAAAGMPIQLAGPQPHGPCCGMGGVSEVVSGPMHPYVPSWAPPLPPPPPFSGPALGVPAAAGFAPGGFGPPRRVRPPGGLPPPPVLRHPLGSPSQLDDGEPVLVWADLQEYTPPPPPPPPPQQQQRRQRTGAAAALPGGGGGCLAGARSGGWGKSGGSAGHSAARDTSSPVTPLALARSGHSSASDAT
jgi:hypothetical protein